MERVYADRANDHAAELAYQYHRSAAIAGAERGVPHALAAADKAESAYAHDEAAQFLGIAVDLLPVDDPRRPRLFARFAVALAWSMRFDECVATAIEAATAIATAEGEQAAADFLANAAQEVFGAGSLQSAWRLAEAGLPYAKHRDRTWSRLTFLNVQRREAANPDRAGTSMPMDAPEFDDFVAVVRSLPFAERTSPIFANRDEALRAAEALEGVFFEPLTLGMQAGELAGVLQCHIRQGLDRGNRSVSEFILRFLSYAHVAM
jgi:hypothetical protein